MAEIIAPEGFKHIQKEVEEKKEDFSAVFERAASQLKDVGSAAAIMDMVSMNNKFLGEIRDITSKTPEQTEAQANRLNEALENNSKLLEGALNRDVSQSANFSKLLSDNRAEIRKLFESQSAATQQALNHVGESNAAILEGMKQLAESLRDTKAPAAPTPAPSEWDFDVERDEITGRMSKIKVRPPKRGLF